MLKEDEAFGRKDKYVNINRSMKLRCSVNHEAWEEEGDARPRLYHE